MFNSLRNKFTLITSAISLVILLISFAFIYYVNVKTSETRDPIPHDAPSYSTEINNIIEERVEYDRKEAQNSLVRALISSGIMIEIIVIVGSFLLADKIIAPVKKSYESQKLFIANASHEIKTPLAAIQANLEAADISGNQWIDNVSYETTRLAALNADLLTLSKLDIVEKTETKSKIHLEKFLSKVTKAILPRLENKKLDIDGKDAEIEIEKKDLEQLLNILLDNAIKYSESQIKISYSSKFIEVSNDGKTISPENLDHIFDRFYQVNKNNEGVGLGLSIAKTIADNNHWTIEVSSKNNITTFKILI